MEVFQMDPQVTMGCIWLYNFDNQKSKNHKMV